jgi:hypothetical protein
VLITTGQDRRPDRRAVHGAFAGLGSRVCFVVCRAFRDEDSRPSKRIPQRKSRALTARCQLHPFVILNAVVEGIIEAICLDD